MDDTTIAVPPSEENYENNTVLSLDLTNVPDKIMPIDPGIYDLLVDGNPFIKPTSKGDKMMVVVKYKVASDGPMKDRAFGDMITLTPIGHTQVKRLLLSAGIPISPTGLDLKELNGKLVKAVVVHEVYKNPTTGVSKMNARVQEYMIPSEAPAGSVAGSVPGMTAPQIQSA